MKQYPQISKEERYTISLDLKSGFSYREIARRLGRSPSTIASEVAKNRGLRGYQHTDMSKHKGLLMSEDTVSTHH